MPQQIDVPGMGIVEFPDGMSDDQISAAIKSSLSASQPKQNPNAIGNPWDETKRAFSENLDAVKRVVTDYQPGDQFGHLGRVGGALAAVPGMAFSPLTGAYRSVMGSGIEAIDPLTEDERKKFGLPDAREMADTAMMGLAPRGYSPIGQRTVAPPPPAAADLKKAAVDVYQSPQIKAIQIQPSDVAKLAEKTESRLLSEGFRPTPNSAPGTLGEIERMYPGNVPSVSVDDLRAARRALQKTAKQVGPDFKPTTDAAAATQAIRELDDFLDNISPNLKAANANYRAGKSGELLDYRSMQADRRAAKSGTGMNMENTMRQEVDKISDRGLLPEQRALKDKIVMGDFTRNRLREVGKIGVDGGLSLLLHTSAAWGTGGQSIPIAVGGTLARKLGEILTRRQIAALNKSIRSASPLAQSLPPVALPAPNPLLGVPASNYSLMQILNGMRPMPALMPGAAEEQQY